MYIEMNNKLTFRPIFTEMTLLLVGKSFANFDADVAVTMSDISQFCTGTPNFFGAFYRDK